MAIFHNDVLDSSLTSFTAPYCKVSVVGRNVVIDTKQVATPYFMPRITNVKFQKSERTGKTTTVVFFADGTKEIAVPSDGDAFDPVVGMNMCMLKRMFGNRSRLKKLYKEYIEGYK